MAKGNVPNRSGKRFSKKSEKEWESLENNSGYPKDKRVIPHPVIIEVYINERPCRALVDTGAFSDFMSTTLVDSLGLRRHILSEPIGLQMAVQGSRSKINVATEVEFKYSTILCTKRFDVINLAAYDLVLGTPFMWQLLKRSLGRWHV
jgi:hypothetical protein